MYREGIARFGTDKFSLNDLRNPFRHLTNSSINKLGPGYAEMKDRVGSGKTIFTTPIFVSSVVLQGVNGP